jgi:uncharacterized protein (DUF934 family)
MTHLIRQQTLEDNEWTVLRLAEGDDPAAVAIPEGLVLVPLAVWQAQKAVLQSRATTATLGVWLASHEEPAELAADLAQLQLIGVDFPKFADGRGYSIASLLRSRYHYQAELRAIGDVLRDQLFYLKRCGFDSFALAPRDDARKPEDALAGFGDFSQPYQAAIDQNAPLFRRVQRG